MDNVEIPGVGHTALTINPEVYRVVHTKLDHASRIWKERKQK
jgi:hypothetical protein